MNPSLKQICPTPIVPRFLQHRTRSLHDSSLLLHFHCKAHPRTCLTHGKHIPHVLRRTSFPEVKAVPAHEVAEYCGGQHGECNAKASASRAGRRLGTGAESQRISKELVQSRRFASSTGFEVGREVEEGCCNCTLGSHVPLHLCTQQLSQPGEGAYSRPKCVRKG